eukprot:gene3460-biopygen21203
MARTKETACMSTDGKKSPPQKKKAAPKAAPNVTNPAPAGREVKDTIAFNEEGVKASCDVYVDDYPIRAESHIDMQKAFNIMDLEAALLGTMSDSGFWDKALAMDWHESVGMHESMLARKDVHVDTCTLQEGILHSISSQGREGARRLVLLEGSTLAVSSHDTYASALKRYTKCMAEVYMLVSSRRSHWGQRNKCLSS